MGLVPKQREAGAVYPHITLPLVHPFLKNRGVPLFKNTAGGLKKSLPEGKKIPGGLIKII